MAKMRLADFILRDMETILVQWEAFTGTQLPAAASMNQRIARPHGANSAGSRKGFVYFPDQDSPGSRGGWPPNCSTLRKPQHRRMPIFACEAASTSINWPLSTGLCVQAFFVYG